MTAEVGILNKTAVALATDSAVTISAGTEFQKIYESEDKLFELSTKQPIGIMINNAMSFMEMPLPTIIKDFRRQCKVFTCVKDAGEAFLIFLAAQNSGAPAPVLKRSNENAVVTLISSLYGVMSQPPVSIEIAKKMGGGTYEEAFNNNLSDRLDENINLFSKIDKASFVGIKVAPKFTQELKNTYRDLVKKRFTAINASNLDKFVTLCGHVMKGGALSPRKTGIVITGFGENDRFPTLVAYEIDGIVGNRLKYVETHFIDIDRDGSRAAIVPFAQKDMVDRFVYGLDDEIINHIDKACRSGMEEFATTLQSVVTLNAADSTVMAAAATAGRDAFMSKLMSDTIEQFRTRSRREIEDMVEFMPKPEMANMAEALVDLTSIKRRVSRGMETVGGPIDVAVISREDGFVWVQRKHYFPVDKNLRYQTRLMAAKSTKTKG